MFIKSTVIPETEEQPKSKFSEINMASMSSRPYLSVLNPRSAQSSSDMEFLHSPTTHKSTIKSKGDITHMPLRPPYESTSSLQQKIRHILKRGGSVNSLRHDKTQSVVHYKSLRKSETVLVLSSHQFPTQSTFSKQQQQQQQKLTTNVLNSSTSTEKIRPMNRWRHSSHSIGLVSSSSCSSHLSHHDSARCALNVTQTSQSNRASGIEFPVASLENINQIGSRNVFSESWSSNVQNIATTTDAKLTQPTYDLNNKDEQTSNTGKRLVSTQQCASNGSYLL